MIHGQFVAYHSLVIDEILESYDEVFRVIFYERKGDLSRGIEVWMGWGGGRGGGVLDSSKIWSGEDRGTLVKF